MISKNLRNVTEELFGIPWPYVKFCLVYFSIVFLILLALIWTNSIFLRLLFGLVLCVGIGYFLLRLRGTSNLEKEKRKWLYRYRVHRGNNIVPKYSVPVSFLKEYIPLKKIHPGGLIEYTGGRYGILFELYLPWVPTGGLDVWIPLVTANIIDRLHENSMLKVFHFQRYTPETAIKRHISTLINDSTKTPEQIEHLKSYYDQLSSNATKATTVFFLGLGNFAISQDAEDNRRSVIPGLINGLRMLGIEYRELTDPDQIGLLLRSCFK